MREAYAVTHHASLEWTEGHERAVDRVAAMGRVERIGANLWRAKYQYDASSYKQAVLELIGMYRQRNPRESSEIVRTVVEQCFREWISGMCPSCLGARELIVGDRRVVCDTCQGSGIRHYSDFERARGMSVSLQRVKSLQRGLTWLAGEIGAIDRLVNTLMCEQLERN